MFKVRIRGVNQYVRGLAKTSDATFAAARRGTILAAKHLLSKVIAKFGIYQQTGGDPKGYGRWKKLAFETRRRKFKKYGFLDKPLIGSGDMMDSFSIVEGGVGRLAASVGSDSDVLIHHVYGAPRAHVPMRDPIRVTALEEMDNCSKIIEDEILDEIARLNGW